MRPITANQRYALKFLAEMVIGERLADEWSTVPVTKGVMNGLVKRELVRHWPQEQRDDQYRITDAGREVAKGADHAE